MIAHFLLFVVIPTLLIAAALWDLTRYTIPNLIPLCLTIAFAIAALVSGMPLSAAGLHLATGFAALSAGFALFAFGFIGGGDAKLFAAVALVMGSEHALLYTLWAAIFGGALTLGLLWLRGLPLPGFLARQEWLSRLHDPKEGVPYGVALAAAGFAVLPYADLLRHSGS